MKFIVDSRKLNSSLLLYIYTCRGADVVEFVLLLPAGDVYCVLFKFEFLFFIFAVPFSSSFFKVLSAFFNYLSNDFIRKSVWMKVITDKRFVVFRISGYLSNCAKLYNLN